MLVQQGRREGGRSRRQTAGADGRRQEQTAGADDFPFLISNFSLAIVDRDIVSMT
jgi:hypothetical protein